MWLTRHVVNLYYGHPFTAGAVPFYALQLDHPEVDNPDQARADTPGAPAPPHAKPRPTQGGSEC